jgi:hypothetical protein
MSEDKKSYIKIPLFKGTKADWIQWIECFLACAKQKGYKHILTDILINVPELAAPKNDDEKKIANLNNMAYCELVAAMGLDKPQCNVAFNLVRKTKTKEYEDGNAQMAWKNLKAK